MKSDSSTREVHRLTLCLQVQTCVGAEQEVAAAIRALPGVLRRINKSLQSFGRGIAAGPVR
jgi:hypothetical protein